MPPPIIHRCQHCGYESEISGSLSDFAENPFCRQCGLSTSEGDTKMQDELAQLIEQQLSLNTAAKHVVVQEPGEILPPITYITQHYHHSSHVVPAILLQEDLRLSLESHGINAAALSPSQIDLFSRADLEQRSRLVELWQIAPPSFADRNVGNWPKTSLQQEEEAARNRYLKMTHDANVSDQTTDIDSQPRAAPESPNRYRNAEPYMMHGYAETTPVDGMRSATNRVVEYNRALDPTYTSRGWWQHGNEMQPMEHQYGAFAQMRQFYGSAQEDEEML